MKNLSVKYLTTLAIIAALFVIAAAVIVSKPGSVAAGGGGGGGGDGVSADCGCSGTNSPTGQCGNSPGGRGGLDNNTVGIGWPYPPIVTPQHSDPLPPPYLDRPSRPGGGGGGGGGGGAGGTSGGQSGSNSGASGFNGSSSCTVSNFCTGSSRYRREANCSATLLETCAYGCGNGVCLPPPSPTAELSVAPTLVRSGNSTTVSWSTTNTASCSVVGTNGASWTGTSGSRPSVITSQTTFTLSCEGLDDSIVSEIAVVNVIPTFDEN